LFGFHYAEYIMFTLNPVTRAIWRRVTPSLSLIFRSISFRCASRQHQQILGALFAKIYNYLEDKACQVYPGPFDARPYVSSGVKCSLLNASNLFLTGPGQYWGYWESGVKKREPGTRQ
jgi:hypothetical protein